MSRISRNSYELVLFPALEGSSIKAFTAAVFWQGKRLAEGEGKTKKQAEQAAALEALRAIQD